MWDNRFKKKYRWICVNGAKSSATIYSIIETSKSNNLSVEKYLIYLMNLILSNPTTEEKDLLNAMPWSITLPEDLQLQRK